MECKVDPMEKRVLISISTAIQPPHQHDAVDEPALIQKVKLNPVSDDVLESMYGSSSEGRELVRTINHPRIRPKDSYY